MLGIGQLMQALQGQIVEPENIPDLWLVVPYSQWFLRSDLALEVTRRAIRTLCSDLGIIPQVVGEHQLQAALQTKHRPRFLLVPGVQTFSEQAWQVLSDYVQDGATLFVSGTISRDIHNLALHPDLFADVESDMVEKPVSRYEELHLPSGEKLQVTFGGAKIGYVRKNHNRLITSEKGSGRIIWSGLPLELSDSSTVLWQVYRQLLGETGFVSGETQAESPLLVAHKPLKDGTLILFVSESAEHQQVTLAEAGIQVEVAPSRAGAMIVKNDATYEVFGGVAVI
jgi:hypothetical protein